MGSPCTLLLLASSSVFSSGLEPSAGLRSSERAFSLCLSPPSFFVLPTVCFLPPDLMCVPLGGCADIRLCLVCESDSRDRISGRASSAKGPSSAGVKLEGAGTREHCSQTVPRNVVLCHRIIAVSKNEVFTPENQGCTEMIL